MLRQRQLRRAIGYDDQQPHRFELAHEVSEQIYCRDISPVHVIEEEDARPDARYFLQEGAEFTFHPLLRSCFDVR